MNKNFILLNFFKVFNKLLIIYNILNMHRKMYGEIFKFEQNLLNKNLKMKYFQFCIFLNVVNCYQVVHM